MATDAFLQFSKPSALGNLQPLGESLDPLLKNAIQLIDFTMGVENVTTIGSASGGAGAGKAVLKQFVIKKKVDKATGALVQACCQGAHFPEAVVSVRRSGATGKPGAPYLIYRFSMIFCTSVNWAGPGDDSVEEEVTFAYGAMQVSYQASDAAGLPQGTPAMVNWSQLTNKPEYIVS